MIINNLSDFIAHFDELQAKAEQAQRQHYEELLQKIKLQNPEAKMDIEETKFKIAKMQKHFRTYSELTPPDDETPMSEDARKHFRYYKKQFRELSKALKSYYFISVDTSNLYLTFFTITKLLPPSTSDKPNIIRCISKRQIFSYDMKSKIHTYSREEKIRVEDLAEMEITETDFNEAINRIHPPESIPHIKAIINNAYIPPKKQKCL